MDIDNRTPERAVLKMDLTLVLIVIIKPLHAIFYPDMLPAF